MLNIHRIKARDIPDLWFQAVNDIQDYGRRFTIDRGSYAGQTRLEYDYFIGHILHPGTIPLLPGIPAHIGIPDPVEHDYVFGGPGYSRSYIEYLMTPHREPGEDYTYGERLTEAAITDDDGIFNQINHIILQYQHYGHRNNQLVLRISQPSDLLLDDPPCLERIDTRIQDNRLHFFVYFRSWDLWGGLPANLAAIQTLKEYMAAEIGVQDGEMIVESKGLHLYNYVVELARMRCMR